MSYLIKAILGGGLFLGSVALFNIQLLELLETGTCASGGPYQIARPCPEGTGTDILLLTGSIFAGLIGATIFATRGPKPWGDKGDAVTRAAGGGMLAWAIFFSVTGGIVLVASLTNADYGDDAKLGGIIVGATFLIMGLPALAFLIWKWIDDWRNPPADTRFQPSTPQATTQAARSTTVPTSWPMAGGGAPPQPQAAASDPELDELEQLERLQRLRESGALTDAEFEQQKRRILGG